MTIIITKLEKKQKKNQKSCVSYLYFLDMSLLFKAYFNVSIDV